MKKKPKMWIMFLTKHEPYLTNVKYRVVDFDFLYFYVGENRDRIPRGKEGIDYTIGEILDQ